MKSLLSKTAIPVALTINLTGDLADAGTFAFESFFRTSSSPVGHSTEHLIQTYSGGAGTFTAANQCLSVFDGSTSFVDTCEAVVVDGTGAYEGVHGRGTCAGVINLFTGIATRVCQLRLNF